MLGAAGYKFKDQDGFEEELRVGGIRAISEAVFVDDNALV
jgi:hypothetical protein